MLSRFDAVTGYDVRRGTERWQYVPPGRSDVCAVSTAADSGIVLLVHGEPGGGSRPVGPGCATVAAVDLSSGRELWHTARVNADRWSRAGHPLSVYRRW